MQSEPLVDTLSATALVRAPPPWDSTIDTPLAHFKYSLRDPAREPTPRGGTPDAVAAGYERVESTLHVQHAQAVPHVQPAAWAGIQSTSVSAPVNGIALLAAQVSPEMRADTARGNTNTAAEPYVPQTVDEAVPLVVERGRDGAGVPSRPVLSTPPRAEDGSQSDEAKGGAKGGLPRRDSAPVAAGAGQRRRSATRSSDRPSDASVPPVRQRGLWL